MPAIPLNDKQACCVLLSGGHTPGTAHSFSTQTCLPLNSFSYYTSDFSSRYKRIRGIFLMKENVLERKILFVKLQLLTYSNFKVTVFFDLIQHLSKFFLFNSLVYFTFTCFNTLHGRQSLFVFQSSRFQSRDKK